jgi:V/A-type H+/Na+-transporting ATPase subunit A
VAVRSGRVVRVNGPVVEAEGLDHVSMLDLVAVGERGLPGEVIELDGPRATIQVYEYSGGLRPGERVDGTGGPLRATLGPWLLGGVFDGMLRRLDDAGDLLSAVDGRNAPAQRGEWSFAPAVAAGTVVGAGDRVGSIDGGAVGQHVLVPSGCEGELEWVADPGRYGADTPVARVAGASLTLGERWPVRVPRPVQARLDTAEPLITGQRVIDLLYPVGRGGTVAIPGGFGTGKTVLLQQIGKWCDGDVIVYVGCGERGNELADVLGELRELVDPRSGGRLLERTVLIANTSNMPVMAREASIHTAATVAEYFRDMGHDVVLIADSTSRWAEALREVASRTGQLPAEEGYPASLASELAAFYERSGRVATLGGGEGSVTIMGAVSPPGGDVTEPVSAHTRRFVRTVWSLDRDLAYARRYPAVSWRDSFSRDAEGLEAWFRGQGADGWVDQRTRALALLSEADRYESVAELVGAESLPDRERAELLSARLLREIVLQQNALSVNDGRCEPRKQTALLAAALRLHDALIDAAERGVPAATLERMDFSEAIALRDATPPGELAEVRRVADALVARVEALG